MSNLKKCKSCEKEIGVKVKKCIHCGEDQRNWFSRHKFITGIVVVAILIAIGTGSGEEEKETTVIKAEDGQGKADAPKETAQTEEPKEIIYHVNDIINDKETEVTITAIKNLDKVGTEYFVSNPSEGGTYIAIQYTIKNVAEEPLSFIEMPSIYLVDENDVKYDGDLEADMNYSIELGDNDGKGVSDLNPGISIKGSEVYEISKESFQSKKWFIVVNGETKVAVPQPK